MIIILLFTPKSAFFSLLMVSLLFYDSKMNPIIFSCNSKNCSIIEFNKVLFYMAIVTYFCQESNIIYSCRSLVLLVSMPSLIHQFCHTPTFISYPANLYKKSSKKTCGQYFLPSLKTDLTTIIMSYNFNHLKII